MAQSPLRLTGHLHLRTRLVLSILSGKPIKIDGIRSNDKNPGLRGTTILIKPGVITGGTITHECPLSRSVGYFLEPLVMLAPFSKNPLNLTLKGITTDNHDLSADLIRTVTLPHLQPFGIEDGLELRIKKRGAPPLGGGEVQFICPIVKQVKTLNFVQPGRIKRIRGISHAVRVSPQFSNRMIDACRSVLNRYIPDIYLYSDVYKKEESGNSPGYALSLVAESTTTALHCSEAVSVPGGTPENVAITAARALLTEIKRGGCVDRHHQILVLLFMVLGSEDIGRVRLGELSSRTIQFLRDVRDFFGTSFKIVKAEPLDPDDDNQDLLLSCYGIGFVNVNKAVA
ncbi:hypothetical protein Clacol_008791 [Clathrus columnatus]|uniref:RNA 3'-terminal phosphate cyclase-like protein n=1 Tax=Clathrus columnatus TaxID=1419009 RepID=A0AAV5AQ64_9AGAM|nr:hypothetical protein Clacol_008791 [Clathrus columnatus]